MMKDDIYIYNVHGSRDTGTEMENRVTVRDNIYVTFTPPGQFGLWSVTNFISNYLNQSDRRFLEYVNNFRINSRDNNIYKTDLEYHIIDYLFYYHINEYLNANIKSIPLNKAGDKILIQNMNFNIIKNSLFNWSFFDSIKDNPDYSADIVEIFNRALEESIITEIIVKSKCNMINMSLQYELLKYMFNTGHKDILNSIEEIEIFNKSTKIKKLKNYCRRIQITTYQELLQHFKILSNTENPQPEDIIIYKYFVNIHSMVNKMRELLVNYTFGNYEQQFVEINDLSFNMNIYDIMLYYFPIDTRIYLPEMKIPSFSLTPFHYSFVNNKHTVGSHLDEIGLYQLTNKSLPLNHNWFTNYDASEDYNDLINCANIGEIYDRYYSHPNNIFPTKEFFVATGECTDGIFDIKHSVADMMDNITLRGKIIIISACAVFTSGIPEPALRRLFSDVPQGYMKYLKYKKKYLELKKQLCCG